MFELSLRKNVQILRVLVQFFLKIDHILLLSDSVLFFLKHLNIVSKKECKYNNSQINYNIMRNLSKALLYSPSKNTCTLINFHEIILHFLTLRRFIFKNFYLRQGKSKTSKNDENMFSFFFWKINNSII